MLKNEGPKELIDGGWILFKKCSCGGLRKFKYKHPERPGIEVHWLVFYRSLRIIKNGRQLAVSVKLNELEQKLNELC